MPYGIAPYFLAFPGTISLRVETLLAVVRDVVACLAAHGFRRILIVNGHGGNAPVGALAQRADGRAAADSRSSSTTGGTRRAPGPRSRRSTRPASHANWMENFPWTRLGRRRRAGRREGGHRPRADARLVARGRARRSSATAASAATTRSRTSVCSSSGAPASRRPASCWRARGRAALKSILSGAPARSAAPSARASARAGHDVLLVDAVAEHVDAMNRAGCHIEGPVDDLHASGPGRHARRP